MEYPWAEDGLDLWAAMHKYFASYVRLYYGSDADVLNDSEVQAWWQELQVSSCGDSTSINKYMGIQTKRSKSANFE
jgi:linoleate 9S-lipoxygenase